MDISGEKTFGLNLLALIPLFIKSILPIAFEMATTLDENGYTVLEFNVPETVIIDDPKLGPERSVSLDIDIRAETATGDVIGFEAKNVASLSNTLKMKRQVLKLAASSVDGRIVVKSGGTVFATLKTFARDNGIGIYFDDDLINPINP